MPEPTPAYACSDRGEIAGYIDADRGTWRSITDDDWRPPREEDLEIGDKYLIAVYTDHPDVHSNTPDYIHWIGGIDGASLDDILDYYTRIYSELGDE